MKTDITERTDITDAETENISPAPNSTYTKCGLASPNEHLIVKESSFF